MKRISILSLSLLFGSAVLLAQGPNNSGTYYQAADGLTGANLKTKLFTIISKKSRTLSYDDLIEVYKTTDTRPDGYVRDWYSNITRFRHVTDKAGSYSKEGDVYNREHSVPQSWGAPKADVVHVFPTDGYVNNRRGNYPFGEVGNATYQSANGYSKLGTCKTAGYSGTVFEPNDEVKGDIARIYFYMATCYETEATNWNGVFGGTKYQPMAQWTFDMMVRWSQLDPVDDVERARNDAVAKSNVQGNRNPFVDYPGLEDYIWGSKKNVAFSYDHYEGGGGVVTDRVAQPVFSPQGGTFTDRVAVTISCATEGATIYYTTNGAEASVNSRVYQGPVTLTESATLRAVAVKEGMTMSYQTMAEFTINQSGQPGEQPAEGTVSIALNNALFGTAFDGALDAKEAGSFSGSRQGVSVVYAKGGGVNQFINDSQLRLYPGNELTLSVNDDDMTEVEFTVVLNKNNKTLNATTGSVADFIWKGSARSITFSVNSGSGHLQLSHVKVKTRNTTTAVGVTQQPSKDASFRTLGGTRVDGCALRPGVYIHNGKKFVVK